MISFVLLNPGSVSTPLGSDFGRRFARKNDVMPIKDAGIVLSQERHTLSLVLLAELKLPAWLLSCIPFFLEGIVVGLSAGIWKGRLVG